MASATLRKGSICGSFYYGHLLLSALAALHPPATQVIDIMLGTPIPLIIHQIDHAGAPDPRGFAFQAGGAPFAPVLAASAPCGLGDGSGVLAHPSPPQASAPGGAGWAFLVASHYSAG